MTTPNFKWTVNFLGGHELYVDGVEGSTGPAFKGSLAYVCKVISLTPGKPIGCSVKYPGCDAEQTYHRDLAEGRAAAEAAVLPYVEQQLAAKAEAETNAVLAVLRAHRLTQHDEDAPQCSCGDWEPETATRDLEEHDEHVASQLVGSAA